MPRASRVRALLGRVGAAGVVFAVGLAALRATPPQVANPALLISDYAAMPITGLPDGEGNNAGSLARINFLREEPASAGRLFVNDLTGPLYILDRTTRRATIYLDFDGRGTRTGLFDKLKVDEGLASGFISFEFDPDYANNGRFYTIHLEVVAAEGSLIPDNAGFPACASPATRQRLRFGICPAAAVITKAS